MYNYYQPYNQTPQYYQQQPMQQFNQQPQMQQPQLKGRPVSSIEEARAAQVDFDGSVFIFPDTANKRIYTKCINMDGTSTLNTFELIPTPQTASGENYVTKQELEEAILQLKQTLIPSSTDNNYKF